MAEILYFIFASFGSSFASFHVSTHAHLHLDGWSLLKLESFLNDGLFIFGALRSASAAMLIVVIVGRILIILLYLVIVAMAILVIASRLLCFHLVRVLLFLLFFIILSLIKRRVLFNLLCNFAVLENLHLLCDAVVICKRHDDSVGFFLALDFNFGEYECMVDVEFVVGVKENGSGVLGGVMYNFGCIVEEVPYLLWILLARSMEMLRSSEWTR